MVIQFLLMAIKFSLHYLKETKNQIMVEVIIINYIVQQSK